MKHTISILVENHAGVLSRISGLFSRRSFNIDSLAVGVTDDPTVSRITIIVNGDDYTVEQVTKQLNKMVDVIKLKQLDSSNDICRELMLIKVRCNAKNRSDLIDIAQLMEAVRAYVAGTRRRVVFEYALIDGLNSRPAHARELARLLRGLQCHVNLIPLNHVDERRLRPATPDAVRAFQQTLEAEHISATVRREMGADIGGACGQLRRSRLRAQA